MIPTRTFFKMLIWAVLIPYEYLRKRNIRCQIPNGMKRYVVYGRLYSLKPMLFKEINTFRASFRQTRK